MSPTNLAAYLRVIVIYAVAVAATAGAGYELVKTGDFNNPLVVFAGMYLSTILGFHIGITSPSPAPAVVTAPSSVPTSVTVPVATATASGSADPNPPIA